MIAPPEVVQTTEQPTAIIRLTIPRSEIRNVMGPGYQELMATVAAQGITPTGPWFTHHLRMDPEVFDFELGVPIAAPITPAGRVVAGSLPATSVARTIYTGGYEGLSDAWAEFDTWLTANGHAPGPNLWESFVAGPETGPNPETWCTELNRPLQ
jgi:effector-binding domain-containing protein